MIRVHEVRRQFDDVVALDSVSFEVPRGVICGFVGPNGAGKSTTMRILATLDLPDQGLVEVNGLDVMKHPHEVRRELGFMPDHAGVIEHLLVSEYLEFFARSRGLRGAARVAEQARIADFTGLTRLLDRPVSGLSKGELQRLSLSRALFGSPSLLILDEPAAGLDPRARVELRELLRALVASSTATVLISSHILSELGHVPRGGAPGGARLVISRTGRVPVVENQLGGDVERMVVWLDGAAYEVGPLRAGAQVELDNPGTALVLEHQPFITQSRMGTLLRELQEETSSDRFVAELVRPRRLERLVRGGVVLESHAPSLVVVAGLL